MNKITPEEFAWKIKKMFDNRHYALSASDIMEIKGDLENMDINWLDVESKFQA